MRDMGNLDANLDSYFQLSFIMAEVEIRCKIHDYFINARVGYFL